MGNSYITPFLASQKLVLGHRRGHPAVRRGTWRAIGLLRARTFYSRGESSAREMTWATKKP